VQIGTISVLGYGWLGMPLANRLLNDNYCVNASTTSASKLAEIALSGASPYLIELGERCSCSAPGFFDADVLIVNFPPKRRPDIVHFHTAQIKGMLQMLEGRGGVKILFVSSTSVYNDNCGNASESTPLRPTKESGKALAIAEDMIMQQYGGQATVLRLAGLVGGQRLPGRFLSGKAGLKAGQSPVNLIHRDDCVNIIAEIIKQGAWGEIFNAAMLEHPSRADFYSAAAKAAGMPVPVFCPETESSFKQVQSSKIRERLGYKFLYDSPFDIV
jgi:nucleoside-diphosphate-sugar epimerase